LRLLLRCDGFRCSFALVFTLRSSGARKLPAGAPIRAFRPAATVSSAEGFAPGGYAAFVLAGEFGVWGFAEDFGPGFHNGLA
jgi:hypothetical protein